MSSTFPDYLIYADASRLDYAQPPSVFVKFAYSFEMLEHETANDGCNRATDIHLTEVQVPSVSGHSADITENKQEELSRTEAERQSVSSATISHDSHPEVSLNGDGHEKEAIINWIQMLKAMKDEDRDLLERLRDELNNLLIFAGLFSAVVTAFTVESYSWLGNVPQSQGRFAELRKETTRQPLLDATPTPAGSIPLVFSSHQSSTVPVAVTINTLWVISLTLSLISAFFAITAQQWLRHTPLPSDLGMMSVQKLIPLRQLRHNGLRDWRVADLVNLLPIVLQAAVVLFLVGLLYLFRELDRRVYLPLLVLLGITVPILVGVELLPFIFIHCPYKSPFIPILVTLCRTILAYCGIGAISLLTLSSVVFRISIAPLRFFLPGTLSWYITAVSQHVSFYSTCTFMFTHLAIKQYFWSHLEGGTYNMFWLRRELLEVPDKDVSAVRWALSRGWSPVQFKDYIQGFSRRERTLHALHCLCVDLRLPFRFLRPYSIFCPVDPRLLKRVDPEVSKRNANILLDSLTQAWHRSDDAINPQPFFDPYLPSLLVLLHAMQKHLNRPFQIEFTQLLMNIRDHLPEPKLSQVTFTEKFLTLFRPSGNLVAIVLIYECCICSGYSMQREDATRALTWATQPLIAFSRLSTLNKGLFRMPRLERTLGSSAVALFALTKYPSLLSMEETGQLFDFLGQFLRWQKPNIQNMGRLCYHGPEDSVAFVISLRAVVTICECLSALANHGHISDSEAARQLLQELEELCKGQIALAAAWTHIQNFTTMSRPHSAHAVGQDVAMLSLA